MKTTLLDIENDSFRQITEELESYKKIYDQKGDAHKSVIYGKIKDASCHDDLEAIISSIELDDVKKLLTTYLQKQESSQKVFSAIYYSSILILTILSQDVCQSIFEYLDFMDIFKFKRISKEFNKICNHITKQRHNILLLKHPVFKLMFDEKYIQQKNLKIAYYLQNRYITDELREELGISLKNKDLVIWGLCTYYKFVVKLLGYCDAEYGRSRCFDNIAYRDLEWSKPAPNWQIIVGKRDCSPLDETAFKIIEGVDEYMGEDSWREGSYSVYPMLEIECPNSEWRSSVIAKLK